MTMAFKGTEYAEIRGTTRFVLIKSSGISDVREFRAKNNNPCESVQSVVCIIFGRADPAPTMITGTLTRTKKRRTLVRPYGMYAYTLFILPTLQGPAR
jgi:hypothetical protein